MWWIWGQAIGCGVTLHVALPLSVAICSHPADAHTTAELLGAAALTVSVAHTLDCITGSFMEVVEEGFGVDGVE